MSSPVVNLSSVWKADRAFTSFADEAPLSPMAVDLEWQPLTQSWLRGSVDSAFNPGWARIRWAASALHYDIILLGSQPRNRARSLNERTWELGDVCEIFVQVVGQEQYLEIHITPENQRLQLRWPADGLARFREGQTEFGAFTVEHRDWMQSATRLGPGFWIVHAILPFTCLDLEPTAEVPTLRTAICRYDYEAGTSPVLSSTALLSAPDFHRPREWHTLKLSPE